MLKRLLTPRLRIGSVADLQLDHLADVGVRGLLLDLDNTIMPWHGRDICPRAADWIDRARSRDFRLCLVSNARHRRLRVPAEALGIPCVAQASKPSRRALRRALRVLDLEPGQAAMVGDQVFTDVLAGNRLGLYTILVDPLHGGAEQWWMRGVRRLERQVVRL